jgi:hypothetical protein
VRLVNAAALLGFLFFVILDVASFLPRVHTLETRNLVLHSVFDTGAIGLIAFSAWLMFFRGPLRPMVQLKLLCSFGFQLMVMVAIAFVALDPWAAYAEAESVAGDRWISVLTSFAILLMPTAVLALLLRWSLVSAGAPAPVEAPVEREAPRIEFEEGYYEPPSEWTAGTAPTQTHATVAVPALAPIAAPPSSPQAGAFSFMDAVVPARNATVALLRISQSKGTTKRGKTKASKHEGAVVGSAVCVVAGRYLVTAHHVLNSGLARRDSDRFFALVVRDNGAAIRSFPVTRFVLEDVSCDLAVLEIAGAQPADLSALPVCSSPVYDGTPVLAMGFPSPPIADLETDDDGKFISANMLLKSHALNGIVSAQYPDRRNHEIFEFNMAWHHGQSGGPVSRVEPPVAVFSVMQDYRPLQGPRGGAMAGPYQGRSLKTIEAVLRELGATFV